MSNSRLSFAIVAMLSGCVSAPTNPDVITAVGRIVKVMPVGTMTPGSGSSLAVPTRGGGLAMLPTGMGTPAHFAYVIKRNDGLEQIFQVFERFETGDCVAVWTDKENEGLWHIRLGKAALKASSSCTG